MPYSVRLLSLVLLVLTACPDNPDDTPDAGEQEVPDLCNSKEEALSSPECQLVLGQQMERYISFGGDQDWYSVQMPSTVGVRSLVRVTALYDTPFTAVNLSVKFQRENGDSLVLEKVDMHGQGQPRPIEFTIPFTEPGAKLLLLLADKPSNPSRPGFDVRNPYFLKVEVLENPDSLEPNDAPELATPVALTNQNGVLVGSSTGYLATPGDVDRFSFNVPVGKIVYVHLTAPYLAPPEQPPAYIFSYKLLRPDQTAEVDRRARTNVVAVDLATARRVETGGTWQVLVQAWDSDGPGNEPPPGDVRLRYTLDVRVVDEADPNDKAGGNEVMAKARVGVMDKAAPPAKVTTAEFTGRLGSEKDLDWYAVDGAHLHRPQRAALPSGVAGRHGGPLPGAALAAESAGVRPRRGAGLLGHRLRHQGGGVPQGLRREPGTLRAPGEWLVQPEHAPVPALLARGVRVFLQPAQLRGHAAGGLARHQRPLLLPRPGRGHRLGGGQGLPPGGGVAGRPRRGRSAGGLEAVGQRRRRRFLPQAAHR